MLGTELPPEADFTVPSKLALYKVSKHTSKCKAPQRNPTDSRAPMEEYPPYPVHHLKVISIRET